MSSTFSLIPQAHAAIVNKALGGDLGQPPANAGQSLSTFIARMWMNVITIGAFLLLIYLIWGGLDWITSGGDSSKTANARKKITQAIIGMIVLAFSFVIVGFVSSLLFGSDFNLLNLSLTSLTTK